jgi:tRNA dimethylallyltransferase
VGNSNQLIIICGPTGIGKTRIAIDLAKDLKCEIISADSRQIYKELNIGTGAPSAKELTAVPHHFVRSHSIHQYYNAYMFETEVLSFLSDYFKRKRNIIMVGGSGLYIDAICMGIDDFPTIDPAIRNKWQTLYKNNGLKYLQEKVKSNDKEYYTKVDKNNPKRLLKAIEVFEMTGKPYSSFLAKTHRSRPFSIIKIGLNTRREILYDRINRRVDHMIDAGLIEEARKLYSYRHLTPLNTVGYKELFAYFESAVTMDTAIEQIKNHSRAYARRQITWFRRDKSIQWFEPENYKLIIKYIEEQLKVNESER